MQHARRLKDKLEEMRYQKLEDEIRRLPKEDRKKFKQMISYGDSSQEQRRARNSSRKSSSKGSKTHKKVYSQFEPQIFDSEYE